MKLQYISCHSVLEYDEAKLLSEIGVDVYCNGAYRDPKGAYTLPRPGISTMKFDQKFFELTAKYPKTALPPELIEPFDVIMIMHDPEVLFNNWPRIKHKRVIWRSIGQSVPSTEARLFPLAQQGLELVRYSLKEKKLPNYAGSSAYIPFYKDPDEFKGYTGENPVLINFSQSLLGRQYFCHYDEIMEMGNGFDLKIYGTGNNDLGRFNGGDIPYDLMKEKMRTSRVYLYGGTWPAPYTLSFIEAMMTGIPVVAIGKALAESGRFEPLDFYEVAEIITNGVNGYCSNNITELRRYIKELLEDKALAMSIGALGRQTAIKYFGKDMIKLKWKEFLNV